VPVAPVAPTSGAIFIGRDEKTKILAAHQHASNRFTNESFNPMLYGGGMASKKIMEELYK
jgi:hypothetical protein